jgi:hypothetical protein
MLYQAAYRSPSLPCSSVHMITALLLGGIVPLLQLSIKLKRCEHLDGALHVPACVTETAASLGCIGGLVVPSLADQGRLVTR